MMRDVFDSISPADYRYWREDVAKYVSENARIRYYLNMELALVEALYDRGMCSERVVDEIKAACKRVTADDVYAEEARIRHNIRAVVNCIRARVSDEAKPYVHMTATSYDIISSADAARYRDAMHHVVIPSLIELERVLITITLREADTIQIGRTHGQHAVPITFGFAIAEYVSRLGDCIENLNERAYGLTGKFSGAVGAYNASLLFFDDPEEFEMEVLGQLDLDSAEYSTQIVPPEALARLLYELTLAAGVMANLARDMRNLQRTEIGEVGEEFAPDQVGSSTMPQKRNPINFENAESLWKAIMPRMMTVLMDQISEHQRDLTNSASSRTYGEIIAFIVSMAKRLTETMGKLVVDREALKRNFDMQKGLILAEPLQLMLSKLGHPDAHEKVRRLTLQAQRESRAFQDVIAGDAELQPYLALMTRYGRDVLSNPSLYTGIAAKKARAVAERWKREFGC